MIFLAIILAGFVMEFVWAIGTIAVQKRSKRLCRLLAFVAPYLNAAFAALTVVDETEWGWRALKVTIYSLGSVAGLEAAFWLYPEKREDDVKTSI